MEQKCIFVPIFNRCGLWETEQTLGRKSVNFQTTDRQRDFRPSRFTIITPKIN